MSKKAPKTFGFVIKHNVDSATKLAIEAEEWLKKKKDEVLTQGRITSSLRYDRGVWR